MACREWPHPGSSDASGSGTSTTTVKLIEVVPGGQETTQFNMMVHDHNLTMDNANEGLTVCKDSSDLINPKEGPVHICDHSKESTSAMVTNSSDVVSSTVLYSEVIPSDSVAVTTLSKVAQETAGRQLPVYWGDYINGFAQAIDGTLMINIEACDTIVPRQLFEHQWWS